MDRREEKMPIFTKSITLGNIITIFALLATGIGIYNQLYADVNTSKVEIIVLKQNEVKRDNIERENKQDLKQDIRDVKADVNKVNDKVDKVLYELNRNSKR